MLSIEQDPLFREAQSRAFAGIVHMSRVEDFTADLVRLALAKKNFAAVLVGGGAPCQGNTSFNLHRRGWDDPRSQQPCQLQRILKELRQETRLPVYAFLENVASAPPAVVEKYTHLLQGPPIMIDALDWGYVHRRRLFWLVGPAGGITAPARVRPPPNFEIIERQGFVSVSQCQPKPWPGSLRLENGFALGFDVAKVLKGKQKPAHTFTREYPHPEDRAPRASSHALARFRQDQCRFPVTAYEPESLVWKGKEWRTFSPAERAAVHGTPLGLIDALGRGLPRQQRTALQNGALGNGYHSPSLMLALFFLFQLGPVLDAVAAPPWPVRFAVTSMSDFKEIALAKRFRGSPFAPVIYQAYPGILTASDLIADFKVQLQEVDINEQGYMAVLANLKGIDLTALHGVLRVAWGPRPYPP